jgi:hypothetical protein
LIIRQSASRHPVVALSARGEYDRDKGTAAFSVTLTGRDNRSDADVSGTYPIIGPWSTAGFIIETDDGPRALRQLHLRLARQPRQARARRCARHHQPHHPGRHLQRRSFGWLKTLTVESSPPESNRVGLSQTIRGCRASDNGHPAPRG